MARVLDRRLDLLGIAFLFGLALLLSSRQILFGGTFYDYDILLMSIPAYSWFAEGLRQGQFHIWSPDVLGGFPLSFAIYTFLYPPDILLLRLLDAARAFHISLALHLGLAGACCYWYCRVLGMRRLPSLLAAVAFQMGNQVLTWQSNGFITKTLFVLPALLASIELTFGRCARYWLLLPLIVGVGLLGGYAQVVLYGLAAAGVYALVVAHVHKESLGSRRALWLLCLLAIGVALGFGLAAVRVAPTLAATSLSTRGGGMDFTRSAVDSIEPWALVAGYLLPAVFELPGMAAAKPDYVGIPVLMLALLAIAAWRRLDRVAGFHLTLATVAMALSLGSYTPAYGLLLKLPFFSWFREPDRFSPVAALAIAVLGAWVLDRGLVLDLPARRKLFKVAMGLSSLLVLAAATTMLLSLAFQFGPDPLSNALRSAAGAGGWDALNLLRPRVGVAVLCLVLSPLLIVSCARRWISHEVLEWSALALSAVTLFVIGWIQNPWLPPSALYEPPAMLKSLKVDPEPFRIFSWTPRFSTYNVGVFYRGQIGFPQPSQQFEERYLRQFIPPNLGMLFGVSTAEWYDALQTTRQALFANYMGSERAETGHYANGDFVDWNVQSMSLQARLKLLAAFNVKYITHAFPIDDPQLELVDQTGVQIYPDHPTEAKVYLYRLKDVMPRAFVVPASQYMPVDKGVLEALMAGTVNLRERVILEQQPPSLPGPPLTASGSSTEIVGYGGERVTLRAKTDGSGYLVLMDFLLPGWSATVDGRPAPIVAGNYAGRAVPIQGSGDHIVEFNYRPPLLYEGLAVSLVSLMVLVAAAVVPRAWIKKGA